MARRAFSPVTTRPPSQAQPDGRRGTAYVNPRDAYSGVPILAQPTWGHQIAAYFYLGGPGRGRPPPRPSRWGPPRAFGGGGGGGGSGPGPGCGAPFQGPPPGAGAGRPPASPRPPAATARWVRRRSAG